jgi:uncharacterized RDD family membrane protein YckC
MRQSKTYELADITNRLFALIIDGIIVGIFGGVLGISVSLIEFAGPLGFLLGAGYQWYFLTQQNGRTPGKMIMGLQVIKTDGTKITDAEAVLRYVGYLINTPIILLGWLWAMFDGRNQGWHDKIANTYVVKYVKSVDTDDVLYYEEKKKKRKNDEYM